MLDLRLGSRTDTRHGKTDVDSGTNTTEEELSLQEDLTIGNGNDLVTTVSTVTGERSQNHTYVSRNVSGDITTLGLNDGKGSKRASTELVTHLGGTLKETGVQVEDITRVSLTTGGATEEERHLTVSHGLLRQIVVHNQGWERMH
jgi:hypothetical protein